ncbi:bifunctional ADP-dependent NAD(P)H-hydrate dehydratase/NAD(P)H-hydrate epimerase [Sphingomonas sanguinis]|uniref:Bifunctional NAD(P)H-hydrate repair enzyme n=1 Tax=Sphingomonas sanguinis TaxID=33051 RepID=A0A147J8A5_9SPHN|nr:bifunctional ADP-dependent NAD(P)H-hydrate dehydratase/NAD(P)H-hydrate epimerase [Sphingomonas sanguinis]KTW13063.1 carbohydrate kinase [Sphingomonas sanguinis]
MIPIRGQPVLTAAAMRAAEQAVMTQCLSEATLMDRAGRAIAHAVARLAAGREILVLCGPGNNGGDGYITAARLREQGYMVRVAMLAEPRSEGCRRAAKLWGGSVASLDEVEPAPVLVDALFGTGLSRGLEPVAQRGFARLAKAAWLRIAVDLPSGIATDTGRLLGEVPRFDVTLALGAVKPSHLLQPAAGRMGEVRLLDIDVPSSGAVRVMAAPALPSPDAHSHKYSRGMVAVVAGSMSGASELAAIAAARAGAGYVLLLASDVASGPVRPHAIVRREFSPDALADDRIGAVAIGPGLGRDDDARRRLGAALGSGRPLVIDGDALRLVETEALAAHIGPKILTPHGGEFTHLFGAMTTDKLTATLDAARRSNAIVVHKGADTVIAAPDGRAILCPEASPWLSTAGTGDVLAGAVAAMLAAGLEPLAAAEAGVWLHAQAARVCGKAFIADDLADALSAVRG